jgi:ubiquinone/menaquinone biosynthesis C-methylase UbiE
MEAERLNPWFRHDFVRLEMGNTLSLPVHDETVDLAAQNCLFNILKEEDLKRALAEMYRVLKPHGKLVLSDPIAPGEIPAHLKEDDRLRAMCLSGALTYDRYLRLLVETGFGTIEVRARRPYRMLDTKRYGLEENILLESIEVAAIKDPIPADGSCIFTGCAAIYFGGEKFFDDRKGHVLSRDIPFSVCDKTAKALKSLERADIHVTGPTFFYDGGGCC